LAALGLVGAAVVSTAMAVVPGNAAAAKSRYFVMHTYSSSATVVAGESIDKGFRAYSVNALPAVVQFSAPDLPPGVTVDFSPSRQTIPDYFGGWTTATISVSPSTPLGRHIIPITGTCVASISSNCVNETDVLEYPLDVVAAEPTDR
jgi:hypothetical protein